MIQYCQYKMKDETDIKSTNQLAQNYQTAYTHNYPQYSSSGQPVKIDQIQHDKSAYNMRRSTHYQSEISKQYAIMRSSYESCYSNNQPPGDISGSARNYRLFVNYLNNEQHQGQFIAYCVAKKQSNSGIFSHQRLFVIDSYTKTLMYFSMIPNLPILSLKQLKDPKESIQLSKVSRFYYTPRHNSIGEVIITWLDKDGKKEWHINMGTNKVAKEFGVVLNHIKMKEKIGLREIKRKIRELQQKSNSVNSKEKDTRFIADIKNLQRKKQAGSSSKIIYQTQSSATDSFKAKQKRKEAQRETKKVQPHIEPVIAKKQQQHFTPPQNTQVVQNSKQVSLQDQKLDVNKKIQQHSRFARVEQLITAAQIQLINTKQENQKKQQQLEQMDKKIKQGLQAAQQKQPQVQEKQIVKSVESQKGLQNQQIQVHIEKEPKEMQKQLNPSKMLVSALQTRQQQENERKETLPKKAQSRFQSERYKQNEKLYRMALLEQRKNAIVLNKGKLPVMNISNDSRSRSQSVNKSDYASSRFSKYETQWVVRWLLAKNKAELAEVCCRFNDHCLAKIQVLTETFSESNISQKSVKSLQNFQSEGVEYTFITNQQQQPSKQGTQEQLCLSLLKNNSYLLASIKFKETFQIQIGVPLCCVIEWKGLKVFCQAALASQRLSIFENSQLRLQYAKQLAHFQELAKVSLKNANLQQIRLNNRHFIYFQRASIFPKLPKYNNLELDDSYISKYLKEGIIKNNVHLEIISRDLEDNVIGKTLQLLQTESFASGIELCFFLEKQGLHLGWIPALLQLVLKKKNRRCISVCLSELFTQQLVTHIHQQIIININNTTKKSALSVVYHQLKSWLDGDQQILQALHSKLETNKSGNEMDIVGHVSYEYVLTSVLYQLGLLIEIKGRPDRQHVRKKTTCAWKEMPFNQDNVVLTFVPKITNYSYEVFQQNYKLMNQNLFKTEKMVVSDIFNKQVLLSFVSKNDELRYQQSEFYRLMNARQKIKVNQYLAYYLPYDPKQNIATHSPQLMYHCLKANPTCSILTKQQLNCSLLGIRWLIKFQKYFEANIKLEQQMLRVLIWSKQHLRLLIDLYDLKFQLAELMHDYGQAMISGWLSLQTTITHFELSKEEYCGEIVSKYLRVADIHFKQSKFEKALELYQEAARMLEKMEDEDIQMLESQQLVEIYNRQMKIAMILCRMEEAFQSYHYTLEQFKRYSDVFRHRKDILQKIVQQQFNAHLLVLRCYQISADYASVLAFSAEISKEFVEEDLQPSTLNIIKPKLSQFSTHKFVQILKYLWVGIIHTSQQLKKNAQQVESQYKSIDIARIQDYVQKIRQSNRGLYRYSLLQVYKHVQAIIESLFAAALDQLNDNSILLALLVMSLQTLSRGEMQLDRVKIYDENARSDQLLFLQCMLQVLGYQFAMGTLMQLQNQYIF